MRVRPMNARMPMIRESRALPTMKLWKILWIRLENTVCCFFGSQSVDDFPQLAQKVFFVKEHVKGNEDGHDQIEYETSHGKDIADECGQHFGNSVGILKECQFAAACLQVFGNAQNRCQQSVDDVVYIFPVDEIHLHEQIFDLLVQCCRINRKLFCEADDRCFDLRHQINGDPDDAANDQCVDQRNGNRTGYPWMPLEKRVILHGMPFKEIDEGIHDISDHKAHEKRQTQTLCHCKKCMYGIADAGQVAYNFFKKHCGCQYREHIYSNFKIRLICFFPIPFFQCRCAPLYFVIPFYPTIL